MNLAHPLHNRRGLALIFVVLVFAGAATGLIGLLVFGVHLRQVEQEQVTRQRLEHIRKALENYYLIHQNLPDPQATTPPNSVPVEALLLPQRYRFDHNGQRIWYDAYPLRENGSTEPVIMVDNTQVGAVLVAPGPDRLLQTRTNPYRSGESDDILLPVSLTSQAIRIATHAVEVLQAAAKAYDALFYLKNNDVDTIYYPPEIRCECTRLDNPASTCTETVDICGSLQQEDCQRSSENSFTCTSTNCSVTCTGITPTPQAIIDEDGYSPAIARAGTDACTVDGTRVCVCLGVLGNDPSRGTASLDACDSEQTIHDLALAMHLGKKYEQDPWGNPYKWGSSGTYGDLDESLNPARDPRYWSVFSLGPDGQEDTEDDIIPTNDRIPGYDQTNRLPVPDPVIRRLP